MRIETFVDLYNRYLFIIKNMSIMTKQCCNSVMLWAHSWVTLLFGLSWVAAAFGHSCHIFYNDKIVN